MSKSCFGTYDMRGIYTAQVNEKQVYGIGRVFPDLVKGKELLWAGMRGFLEHLCVRRWSRGLLKAGAEVVDIGVGARR